MTDILESDTPYVKGSQKTAPPKADHKHEYFKYVAWNYIRRFNGTVSDVKYKFSLPATCIDCGHVNRKAYSSAIEIEVTPKEYRKIKEAADG